jgi:hypothetical protein
MNCNEMPKNIIISSKKIHPLYIYNKYRDDYKSEDQNLKFSEKEGKIKMDLINKLDIQTIFNKDNSIILQKILDNLITAKFYKSDYDEDYKYLLFKSFQNSLDYLIAKKNRLIKINKNLYDSANKINNQTNNLQKKLDKNKILIEENSKIKEEKKIKYKELKKEYNDMKTKGEKEQINIEPKNIEIKKSNIEIDTNEKILISKTQENIQEINEKYYCKVCADKFFLSQESLEDHQIKRHPFLIIRKNKEKNDFKEKKKYLENIEFFKKQILDSLDEIKDKEKCNDSRLEIFKQKEENNKYLEQVIENQQKLLEEINSTFKDLTETQNNFINEFSNLVGLNKTSGEIKKEKIKQKNEEKKFEKLIKKEIFSDPLIEKLNTKIKDLKSTLNKYLSQNEENDQNLCDDKKKNKQNKDKIISRIKNISLSQIKEEEEEKVDVYGDKKEKIMQVILNSNTNSLVKQNSKSDMKNELEDDKEKIENNEEEGKNINIDEKDKEQGKEKEQEKEFKEEEEEEEEDDSNNSILSTKRREIPLEIDRIKKTNNEQKEEKSSEMSNYVNNVFTKNNININLNKVLNDNKNSFALDNNNNSENNIKLKSESQEKQVKKVENIIIEIPIHTNKKYNILQSELDEIIKGM